MNTTGPNGNTYSLLLRLMLHSKQTFHVVAEQCGLSMMQAHTLALLNEQPLTMSALGNGLGCDASNVTGIVDRLEALGLVERQDNPQDRRVKLVALSAKGDDTREAIVQKVMEVQNEELGPVLSEDERATLNRLLDKLLERANKKPADR